jgi:aspartate/methionine/tyrosine aminotransferase
MQSLSYAEGLGGDPALLTALSSFFNTYFSPSIPVIPDHITAASGAGNCLDALMCGICEPGDMVIVPGPFFCSLPSCFHFQTPISKYLAAKFGPYFQVHAQVNIIGTSTQKFSDSLTACLQTLKFAYATAPDPKRIKALVMTNPHNPFGQCYPREVLLECMRFCQEHGLHYISDEIFALSVFETPDSKGNPFVSALSLMDEAIDSSRVHVVWSASKDFGCSGIRMVCNSSICSGLLLGF